MTHRQNFYYADNFFTGL